MFTFGSLNSLDIPRLKLTFPWESVPLVRLISFTGQIDLSNEMRNRTGIYRHISPLSDKRITWSQLSINGHLLPLLIFAAIYRSAKMTENCLRKVISQSQTKGFLAAIIWRDLIWPVKSWQLNHFISFLVCIVKTGTLNENV